jgi:hypothetical protein
MEPEFTVRNVALFVAESVVLFGTLGVIVLAMMCM